MSAKKKETKRQAVTRLKATTKAAKVIHKKSGKRKCWGTCMKEAAKKV